MDGNFIDNNVESLIESADILPESPTAAGKRDMPKDKPGKYDKFRLRLKFSSRLDPNSVNVSNAMLTLGSKRIKTSVEYDKNRRSIIISPKSKYLRNTLYVLRVSGKIMSERGRSLRENRFIVFEQDGDNVSFYRNIKPKRVGRAPNTLIVQTESVLPALFFVSSLVLVFSYFLGSTAGLAVGTVLVLLSTAAAFVDSISDIGRSRREYVYGAKLYNKGFFFEAVECFESALHYYPENIYAKKGLDAAIIKCSEGVD